MERALPSAEIVLTEGPNHATALARKALMNGVSTIIAVGGDGTINEVVNGFFDVSNEPIDTPILGLIPSGTGGDYRKSWGMKRDISESLQRIVRGKLTVADLGRIDCVSMDGSPLTRYFANVASFGMSANVCRRVNRSGKRLGGRLTFFLASARSIVEYKNRRVTMTSHHGERTGYVRVGAVCIGQYFGAGMRIGPDANVGDGLFDIVTLGDLNRIQMLGMTSLYSGKHLAHPRVHHERSRTFRASPEDSEPTYIEADGEVIGRLPATFTIVPGAMQVIS